MADIKNIIDGIAVAEKIREEIKQEIIKLRDTKKCDSRFSCCFSW